MFVDITQTPADRIEVEEDAEEILVFAKTVDFHRRTGNLRDKKRKSS